MQLHLQSANKQSQFHVVKACECNFNLQHCRCNSILQRNTCAMQISTTYKCHSSLQPKELQLHIVIHGNAFSVCGNVNAISVYETMQLPWFLGLEDHDRTLKCRASRRPDRLQVKETADTQSALRLRRKGPRTQADATPSGP